MSLKKTRKPVVMHTIGHQTPATQHLISTAGGALRSGGSSKRSRRSRGSSKKGSSPKRKRASRSGKSSAKRLVKGSAAAKAWGRKMKRARAKK